MRWKPHVRFGRRTGETHPPKDGKGAPVRSHWGTKALDVVRRWIWNLLRRMGLGGQAAHLKGCRYALWKNPEDLTDRQQIKLAWIAKHNQRLYRAYLLKEQLRLVFAHRGDEAVAMLDDWLAWARRSQIPAFVELYHRIKKHRAGIVAAVTHGLSNGPHRKCEHQTPADHPDRLRLPQHRQPHRPVPPRPRRPLPTPTRPTRRRMTHGNSRRATILRLVQPRPPPLRHRVFTHPPTSTTAVPNSSGPDEAKSSTPACLSVARSSTRSRGSPCSTGWPMCRPAATCSCSGLRSFSNTRRSSCDSVRTRRRMTDGCFNRQDLLDVGQRCGLTLARDFLEGVGGRRAWCAGHSSNTGRTCSRVSPDLGVARLLRPSDTIARMRIHEIWRCPITGKDLKFVDGRYPHRAQSSDSARRTSPRRRCRCGGSHRCRAGHS